MTENGFKETLGLSPQEITRFEKFLADAERRARRGRSWFFLAVPLAESILPLAVAIYSFMVVNAMGGAAEFFETIPNTLTTTAPATQQDVSLAAHWAVTKVLFSLGHGFFMILGCTNLGLAAILAHRALHSRSMAKKNLLFAKIVRRLWAGNPGNL